MSHPKIGPGGQLKNIEEKVEKITAHEWIGPALCHRFMELKVWTDVTKPDVGGRCPTQKYIFTWKNQFQIYLCWVKRKLH